MSCPEPSLTQDAFWRGAFHLVQPRKGAYRSGLDALLVASGVASEASGYALDFGVIGYVYVDEPDGADYNLIEFKAAASRAIGETMIVVMAAGLAANMTLNPFSSVTTVTTQIVQLLTGDQEFDSAKTLSAFALGLVLFLVTLALNIIAHRIVQTYREQYD